MSPRLRPSLPPVGAQWTPQASGTERRVSRPRRGESRRSCGRAAHAAASPARRTAAQTWTVDSSRRRLPRLPRHPAVERDTRLGNERRTRRAGSGEDLSHRATAALDEAVRDAQKGVFLDAITFWDDDHGIAMSDPIDGRLFILATDDGGKTWTHVPTDNAPPVLARRSGVRRERNVSRHAGHVERVDRHGRRRARRASFRSTDRGRTWSVAETPVHAGSSASGIFSVAFSDATARRRRRRRLHEAEAAVRQRRGQRRRRKDLAAGEGTAARRATCRASRTFRARADVAGRRGTRRHRALERRAARAGRWSTRVAYNSVAFASRDAGWAAGPRGRIAKWAPAKP